MTNRISASAASLATQNGVGSASYSAVNGASIAGEQESGAGRASSPLPAADTAWGELVKGAVKLLACTGSGIVFGFAVEKSKGEQLSRAAIVTAIINLQNFQYTQSIFPL